MNSRLFMKLQAPARVGVRKEGLSALGRGWSSPEPELVWSDSGTAWLHLNLPVSKVPVVLIVRATVPKLPEGAATQRVLGYANGLFLSFEELDDVGELRFTIPPRALDHGAVDISLVLLDSARNPTSGDQRRIGIALHSLEVRLDEGREPASYN